MSCRILELDLDSPLPAFVPLESYDRLWVIAWREGVPVGTSLLTPEPGSCTISRAQLLQEFGDLQPKGSAPIARPDQQLPAVSVIICTRGRPDRLPIALRALREQTFRAFELVVVENAPADDRTRRVVEECWPEARYVVEPLPGIPQTRNTGARAATGQILAYLDDDCRPIPGWVEAVARSFAAEPRLGCVTGPILPLELETPAQEAMEARGGFNRGFQRVLFTPQTRDGPVYPVQAWKFGAGASMAFSRACFQDLGGFDETLGRSEDIDMFYRTLRAGYALAFEPGAAVRHRHLPAWPQLARRMFQWGRGYLTFLDKIARTDVPEYAARARQEQRNWLRYQLLQRLLPAVRGRADLPLPLVLLELLGGILGMRAYPRPPHVAALRAQRQALRQAEVSSSLLRRPEGA